MSDHSDGSDSTQLVELSLRRLRSGLEQLFSEVMSSLTELDKFLPPVSILYVPMRYILSLLFPSFVKPIAKISDLRLVLYSSSLNFLQVINVF